MTISLDLAKIFDQLIAEADFRTSYHEGGRHFSGSEEELKRALGKVLAPLQVITEDAETARSVLLGYGYGTSDMPLSHLVEDLMARLVDAAGPQSSLDQQVLPNVDDFFVDPYEAMDVIMGRVTPARPNLGLLNTLTAFDGPEWPQDLPVVFNDCQVASDMPAGTMHPLARPGAGTDPDHSIAANLEG